MGKKAATPAAQQKPGAPQEPGAPRRFTVATAMVAVCAAAAAAYFLNHPFWEEESLEAARQRQLEQHLVQADKQLNAMRLDLAIPDLVAAQRLDFDGSSAAMLLGKFQESLGERVPHHIRTMVTAAVEQLELALYSELHRRGAPLDADMQLRLAKLLILYQNGVDPRQAAIELAEASALLRALTPPADIATHHDEVLLCHEVAQAMEARALWQEALTNDLRKGAKAADIAKQLVRSPSFTSVDRRSKLSLEEYTSEYLQKGKPVIITDYAEALFEGGEVWSWEQFREACGTIRVRVSERRTDARHLWAGLGLFEKNQSLSSWIDAVRDGSAPRNGYLMDWGLAGAEGSERCHKFTEAFRVPKYFAGDLWKQLPFNRSGEDEFARHPSLFVGRGGSGGALHVDSFASTFWQFLVEGRKRWTLYSLPDDVRRTLLYAGAQHEIMPHVPPAGDKRARAQVPLLDIADEFKITVELGPGELIVVPHDVPHMVDNLEDVLAISMNTLHHPAVPRLKEEYRARACFSKDKAIIENLRLLQGPLPKHDLSLPDLPYHSFRSYGPRT